MITIRKANLGDLTEVLSLIQELATFEKEPDAVELTVEELAREGFGEHPLFRILIAETADQIVGMALFYPRFSTWKGRTIHLEDLIVKESQRGKGIGRLLYSEVMKIAFEEGVRRVEWVVLDWNTPAVEFYKKTGAQVLGDWRTVQMDQQGLANFIKTL